MKKSLIAYGKRLIYLLLVLLLVSSITLSVHGENEEPTVYLIEIHGEVNRGQKGYVVNSIEEAKKANADMIIYEIDTLGGQIIYAKEMSDAMLQSDIYSVGFINNKAESAGVLLSISCDELYMTPTATIGSAETIPNDEKTMSLWRSFLRNAAQEKNYDEDIVMAMCDVNHVVEGVSEQDTLLNLTAKEAENLSFSDGTMKDLEELLDEKNLHSDQVKVSERDFKTLFTQFITSIGVSSFLVIFGFMAAAVEIVTPGFGLGGTLSILSFGLFFAGRYMGGDGRISPIALFVIGVLLIGVEIIVPGFGLPGIVGIISIGIGLVLAFENIYVGLIVLAIAIIAMVTVIVLLIKRGHKNPLLNKISLIASINTEEGFISNEAAPIPVGSELVAATDLRPSGYVEKDGINYDAYADAGSFIAKGSRVKIVRYSGSKMIVRKVV